MQLLPGRSYMMRIGTKFVPATVTSIKHKIDVNTQDKLAAKTLAPQRDRRLQPLDRRAGRLRSPIATIATPAPSS